MELLHIDASILGAGSVSRDLSAHIVRRLSERAEPPHLTYRDLSAEELPHMSVASLPGDHPLSAMAGELDAAAQAVRDDSQRMLDEFVGADTVVIGVPMYNFSVPSQLKAWLDRIVVPGKTFRYGANGAEGLMVGKRVIVALARGGVFGAGAEAAEHAERYLRTVLGFIGITDPDFIIAEGLATGEDNRAKAVTLAHDAIDRLAA